MHWAWEETWICQVSCFFCCISWKSSTAFPCCPAFTYFPNILFHEKLLPWQPALVPPIGRFIGPRAKSNPVSAYAWHLGTMHSPSLVYNHTTVKDLQKSHTKLSLSGLLLLLVPTFHPEKLLQVTMCPKCHNSRWANGALSPPQRIDEATRLRELEIAGCQTMALWPKWGGLHDRYSKTFVLTMVHSLQSHMSLPHSVNYSIVHNTQSHKLYWSTELWFHTHTRTFGQDYNTFSVWEIGLYL